MAAKQQSAMTFRCVLIGYVDLRRQKESAPFVRLHANADMSKTVINTMGWELGNSVSGKLPGLITAIKMILAPNQRRLPNMAGIDDLEIECAEVGDFGFREIRNKEGVRQGYTLSMVVRSNDPVAAGKLEAFWRQVQGGDCQMKVTYSMISKTDSATDGSDDDPADA